MKRRTIKERAEIEAIYKGPLINDRIILSVPRDPGFIDFTKGEMPAGSKRGRGNG